MSLDQALYDWTVQKAAERVQQWPVNANRASALPWPCPSGDRYLYLLRKNWRDIPAHGGETELLFEEGHLHEIAIANRLTEDGWKLWNPRKASSWPAYQITGSLDREGQMPAVLAANFGLDPQIIYPLEFKALEPNAWGKINSIGDMLNAKQPWLRKYPGQLLMYLWLEEQPTGIFVVKNKVTGRLKFLVMQRDEWDHLASELLDKCQRVNAYLKDGREPSVTGYEESVCGRCELRSVCLPGEVGIGAIPIAEDSFLEALERREELKPLAEEFDNLSERIKSEAKRVAPDGGSVVAGDFEVVVKQINKNMKASEARTLTYSEARIRRLGKGQSNGRESE